MADKKSDYIDAFQKAMAGRSHKGPKEELADISLTNTFIVDDIVKLTRRLAKKNQTADANQLIKIAERILENNKRLQDTVGKVSEW